MVKLYGKTQSELDLAQKSGSLSQFAGVRLVTLEDGVERGIRALEFHTGDGLRFSVLIDRAFDIGDCEYKGYAIGWQSPTGFRNAFLHEYEGEGGLAWMRSFSGLMITCGLDHILFMDEQRAEHYNYEPRKTVSSSIHGRVGTIPGKLMGYGHQWIDGECILYCEGLVQQSTVFGEDLHLIRRIEVKVGTSEIHIKDRVTNHGFNPTPHMFCYHINVGYPVLDENSQYLASIKSTPWAAHAGEKYRKQGVGYKTLSGPIDKFHEQVWEHELIADDQGRYLTAVVNPDLHLGFSVDVDSLQFPAQFEWQNFQSGMYAIGIEPSTHHVLGKPFAEERNEGIWLNHGDTRNYHSIFTIHHGADQIANLTKRIQSIGPQNPDEFPPVTGVFSEIKHG